MIAKVPTNVKTIGHILDSAFEQIKKECGLEGGTIADNYGTYYTMADALETTLRLWRAVDDNYDDTDDIIIEIHPR